MKKILTFLAFLLSFSSFAQIDTSLTYRTPVIGQPVKIITDKYLRARYSLYIPYTASTVATLNGTVDRPGNGLQLLSNGNLAISKGSGTGYFEYTPTTSSTFVSTNGGSIILPSSTSTTGLILRAIPSQTSNIAEFRNGSNTVVTSVSASGGIFSTIGILSATGFSGSNGSNASLVNPSPTGTIISRSNATGDALEVNLINSGSSGDIVKFKAGGTTLALVNKAGNVISTQFRLSDLNIAPASATDTGTLGEIRITSDYIYVCISNNTWVRTPLTTW